MTLELNITQVGDADRNSDWLKYLPEADEDKVIKVLGGKGSGNFGHVGRPGKVGGSGGAPSGKEFEEKLSPKMAAVAQKVYDEWDENVDEYAGGGICHIIADEIAGELQNHGIDSSIVSAEIGEQHVWVVAKLSDGVYNIDISPYRYEQGGGYSWSKIQGVIFDSGDIIVERIDSDPKSFDQYINNEELNVLGGKGSGHYGHAGRKGKVGGSAPKGQFDASEWKDLGFMERKEAWQALSVKERDRLTNASSSINERINAVTSYAGNRPSFDGDFGKAIEARATQLEELAPIDAKNKIIETVKELDSSLGEAGVSDELRHKLNMDATDALFVQENEALGRSLGDHGIAHIQGNIAMSMTMLDEIPGEISARDKAAVYIAGIYHDTGYVAAPSHYFLDEGHPRWSMQHYNNNVKSTVAEALGADRSEEISHIIRTHDSTDINWLEDPAGSAFRVSDNLALFAKEKTPALFRYVPENHWVLQQLGEGKLSVEKAQETMRYNIEATSYNKWIKHELTRSVQEVSPMLPKFTLGMKAGVVDDFKWVDDHIKVSLRKTPEYDYLTKSLDLGQKQFSKLAETYGVDADGFKKDLSFSYKNQAGSTLLEGIVVNEEGFIILNDVFVTNIKFLGGKGSGNFGHSGRPGKVGGSGGGGMGAVDTSSPAFKVWFGDRHKG